MFPYRFVPYRFVPYRFVPYRFVPYRFVPHFCRSRKASRVPSKPRLTLLSYNTTAWRDRARACSWRVSGASMRISPCFMMKNSSSLILAARRAAVSRCGGSSSGFSMMRLPGIEHTS